MPMQTLQVYRKVEKIPLPVQVHRVINELATIRREHSFTPTKVEKLPEEAPRVRTIELQNLGTRLERELTFWVKDYRSMIDEIREFDRIIPKTEHEVEESDAKAAENVQKIIRVEEIKDNLLAEFREVCIRYEDTEERSRRRIRHLETELAEAQAKIDTMEYNMRRLERNKR
jgi:chromosome segregation ATPase